MISIVCVYNDAEVLAARLLRSLGSQTSAPEIITVDNRDSRFHSASAALNWGAARAAGNWLLFAHQDVTLLADDWLARGERMLEDHEFKGWCGIAGSDALGRFRGMLLDRAALIGEPLENPAEVQTLDECLLIHRRKVPGHNYFDEALTGWHAYGVEACCAAIRGGATNYALPLPVWHDSKSTNLAGLEEAHRYVWQKHGSALPRIATSCGNLPDSYQWQRKSPADSVRQVLDRLQTSYYHRLGGYPGAFHHNFDELLESLTKSEAVIECLHRNASFAPIEARAFVSIPDHERRIIHRFQAWAVPHFESDSVVIARDLAAQLSDDLQDLRNLAGPSRALICLDWHERASNSGRWKALQRAASEIHLTRTWDGSRVAIIEMRLPQNLT